MSVSPSDDVITDVSPQEKNGSKALKMFTFFFKSNLHNANDLQVNFENQVSQNPANMMGIPVVCSVWVWGQQGELDDDIKLIRTPFYVLDVGGSNPFAYV